MNNQTDRPTTDAADYIHRARHALEHEIPDRAIAELDAAITREPDNAEAYHLRGFAHAHQDNSDAALADFAHARHLAPDTPTYHETLAQYYTAIGNLEQAIETYTHAIERHPTHASLYQNRALVYKNRKQFDLAIRDMEQAIYLDPSIDPILLEAIHIAARKKKRHLPPHNNQRNYPSCGARA